MDSFEEKVARLPAWAREHIARLEKRAAPNNEAVREASRRTEVAERRARQASEQLDAVHEILLYAAKGGSETAKAYVERVLVSHGCDEEFIPISKST